MYSYGSFELIFVQFFCAQMSVKETLYTASDNRLIV